MKVFITKPQPSLGLFWILRKGEGTEHLEEETCHWHQAGEKLGTLCGAAGGRAV